MGPSLGCTNTRKNQFDFSVIFLNLPSSYSRMKDRMSSSTTEVTIISACPFRFKSEGLTFLKIHTIPVKPLYRPPPLCGLTGAAGQGATTQDFISDILRKV